MSFVRNVATCRSRYRRALAFTSLSARAPGSGLSYGNKATIDATPSKTLVDEKVNIKLCGLDPGSKVTVRSRLPKPNLFEGYAHFDADKNGSVSIHKDPAVVEDPSVIKDPFAKGTYIGVEPMGLFWCMKPLPGQKPGLRFINKNVTTPMEVTLSVHKGHLDTSALQNDIPLAKTQVHRMYMGPDVEFVEVKAGRLRGRVFKPKGSGPFPGVIDMFGIEGGLTVFRAALLASRGFAVYALPYCKYDDLPQNIQKQTLELEYFEEATNWLNGQPYVQPGGIGLCASSWGAEVAVFMATTFPDKISACCSISGSCLRTWAPMTYKGKDLPFLGYCFARAKTVQEMPLIGNVRDVLDPIENAKSIFQLEKAKRLLFIVGEDDQNWDVLGYMDKAERRLKALSCNNYEIVRYPKTGHLIEPPYAPITLTSYNGGLRYIIEWGGSAREHQRAQEDHWPRVLEFLHANVGRQKK